MNTFLRVGCWSGVILCLVAAGNWALIAALVNSPAAAIAALGYVALAVVSYTAARSIK